MPGNLLQPSPNRILIVKLSALGDVVHCLPVLHQLRKAAPEAKIDWLVEEAAADLLIGHPYLDRVWISRRKRLLSELKRGETRTLRETFRLAADLRREEYDLVLDLQGLYKSAVWTWWVKGRKKLGWSGTKEYTGFSLTESIGPENFQLHAVERYLDFIRYLGREPDYPEFVIPRGPEENRAVAEWGFSMESPIAINPVALWETKLWNVAGFSKLADQIVERLGLPVVFTGGPNDRAYVDSILSGMRGQALNFCGKTGLKGLAALYRRCAAVVSTDTGPMHVAAAVGTPVVALFGPTDPARTGPYGPGHQVVRCGIECSPCLKRNCSHRSCMERISVEAVLQAVEKVTLTSRKGGGIVSQTRTT